MPAVCLLLLPWENDKTSSDTLPFHLALVHNDKTLSDTAALEHLCHVLKVLSVPISLILHTKPIESKSEHALEVHSLQTEEMSPLFNWKCRSAARSLVPHMKLPFGAECALCTQTIIACSLHVPLREGVKKEIGIF